MLTLLIGSLYACGNISQRSGTWATDSARENWNVTGKIALKSAQEGHNLGLQWRQLGQSYTITLRGPLGLGQADIQGDGQGIISVTHAGNRLNREQAQLWQLQQFGWELPIQHMKHWILGNASPMLDVESSHQTGNNLSSLKQGAWQVSLSDYRQSENDGTQYELPYQLDIRRGDYRAKLRIRNRHAIRPPDNE
jgi:outer membrane lipoprotein LolB